MALEGGQDVYPDGNRITRGSDGSGSKGDFVTLSAGQVTPTSAADDDIVGVLAQDAPAAGEDVTVVISGIVVANVAGTVGMGDVLGPSATAGQADTNSAGFVQAVDEGGTATYTLSLRGVFAVSAAGANVNGNSLGANQAAVKLL